MNPTILKLKQLLSFKKTPQMLSENKYNQRAQTEYQKILSNYVAEFGDPTEQHDAVLYAQAYQMQITKNPAAAKFPPVEEYAVLVEDDKYAVSGYYDATNSYGAQIRSDVKLNLIKLDGKWVCTNDPTLVLTIYLYIIIGIIIVNLVSLMGLAFYSVFMLFISLLL